MNSIFGAKVVFKDWKYNVKSALITFLTVFIPIVCVEIKDLDFQVVRNSFIAGSFIAALRSFLRLIIEPLLEALWQTGKTLLLQFGKWLKGTTET